MNDKQILEYCLYDLPGTVIIDSYGETGVFRLNLGLRKASFQKIFGMVPSRPKAGEVVKMPYNSLDSILYCLFRFMRGWGGHVF